MLELKIKCEALDEASVYLNAIAYHNLLSDLYAALRNAQKHGTEADVAAKVADFMPCIARAIEHSTGAY